ncbi:CNH domain-containing protein [Suillus fuscotomentosus]|uniref:CNH domain-containing protein n=1 Tax=Suillus fuscotomentosus TaxID=1912939 RepID=A0AAD4HPU2_9AGAM|nr:CNH domain-containing protein [Suillus fuscotomentosus]KAG1903119.1 CNH domain-containing protein [Suillus fuscotomentosus]
MVNSLEVPPYLLQPLIPRIIAGTVTCAQAFGSEIYVGCSNGELLRYALQPDADPTKILSFSCIPPLDYSLLFLLFHNSSLRHHANIAQLDAYALLSQQSHPSGKQIDELILVPCIARVLILCDRQLHIYTLPSLDLVPNTKPVRNVEALAVDHNHLQRPAATSLTTRATSTSTNFPTERGKIDAIDLCVIKRSTIAMYSLGEEKLSFTREIPFRSGSLRAQRSGRHLCIATADIYSVIDLVTAQMFELLPVTQVEVTAGTIKPHIVVISPSEFLLLSWTGGSTLGLFVTGDGDPVRGTLEWPAYPVSVCLDYPYLTTLLPNGTIEVHSVETQTITQVIPAPDFGEGGKPGLVSCLAGYAAPSSECRDKMRKVKVGLVRSGEVGLKMDDDKVHESQNEEVEEEKDADSVRTKKRTRIVFEDNDDSTEVPSVSI